MDSIDLAKALLGRLPDTNSVNTVRASSVPANNTTTIYTEALSDSVQGYVTVQISGETLEIPTTIRVEKDDICLVNVSAHNPVVAGVVGRGDEMYDMAETGLEEAQAARDAAADATEAAANAYSAAQDAAAAANAATADVAEANRQIAATAEDVAAVREDIDEQKGALETVTTSMEATAESVQALASEQLSMKSSISKNAAGLSSTVSEVSSLKTDLGAAQADISSAAKAAEDAAAAAATATEEAGKANADLAEAQAHLAEVEATAGNNTKAIGIAQEAVQTAQNAADTANAAAAGAAAAAANAAAAASKAQSDADALESRVTTAETTITHQAGSIDTLITETTSNGSNVSKLQTLIRETSAGVEVGKTDGTYKALVNAEGSFDVVERTTGKTIARMDADGARFIGDEYETDISVSGLMLKYLDSYGASFTLNSKIIAHKANNTYLYGDAIKIGDLEFKRFLKQGENLVSGRSYLWVFQLDGFVYAFEFSPRASFAYASGTYWVISVDVEMQPAQSGPLSPADISSDFVLLFYGSNGSVIDAGTALYIDDYVNLDVVGSVKARSAKLNSPLPIASGGTGATTAAAIGLLAYPVGAVYISSVSTSPAVLFGGTWTQISDRFLLAAGSGYAAGTTGGEATHKLTTAELPAHSHTISESNGVAGSTWRLSAFKSSGTNTSMKTNNTGSGTAHNNMPPYLVVYMWRRIA